jgi:hypothetical protein
VIFIKVASEQDLVVPSSFTVPVTQVLPINGNEEYVISSYVLGSFFKNQVVVAA